MSAGRRRIKSRCSSGCFRRRVGSLRGRAGGRNARLGGRGRRTFVGFRGRRLGGLTSTRGGRGRGGINLSLELGEAFFRHPKGGLKEDVGVAGAEEAFLVRLETSEGQ